ncbi:hypothetical protein PPSIR1_21154 [Plesiocystis pacifica SIR-1]|uniref:Uncharacterized protein n=1 Tax=Plesiocystis pacifica SIR-1 TaxID=391625 RepID=A6G3H0_9BACT|nr:hypothetical protein PPSIR1_21154 [Plesiocystis pacifica SIR-1]
MLLTIGDVLLEVPACFSVSHLLLLVEALEDPST